LHAKARIGQRLRNHTLHFESFLFFCHANSAKESIPLVRPLDCQVPTISCAIMWSKADGASQPGRPSGPAGAPWPAAARFRKDYDQLSILPQPN
jgi:hypothetical protein